MTDGDWREWDGGLQWGSTSDWHWPSRGIEVDHGGLKDVASQMSKRAARGVIPGDHSALASEGMFPRQALFDPQTYFELPEPMASFTSVLGEIVTGWGIARAALNAAYAGTASLVYVSAFAYAETEKALTGDTLKLLEWGIEGKGLDKEDHDFGKNTCPVTDTSGYDASRVKRFFADAHPEYLEKLGGQLTTSAKEFQSLVSVLDADARAIAAKWPGETSTLCLEALRKLQANAKNMAYTFGTAGAVCESLGAVFKSYKSHASDLDLHENGLESLWEKVAGDDNAQKYLREFLNEVARAYYDLPDKIEIRVPNTPTSGRDGSEPYPAYLQGYRIPDSSVAHDPAELVKRIVDTDSASRFMHSDTIKEEFQEQNLPDGKNHVDRLAEEAGWGYKGADEKLRDANQALEKETHEALGR